MHTITRDHCANATLCALAAASMAAGLATTHADANTIVEFQTSFGNFHVELFDDIAPITVANFLEYVIAGDYDDTFIHRAMPGFVMQGGVYSFPGTPMPITPRGQIENEFQVSNTRGTIAMAKIDGDPDSASSSWFFNLDDNSANLDSQNGGFTVFGQVMGDGMDIIDAIVALPNYNAGPGFENLPLTDYAAPNPIEANNLVYIEGIEVTNLPTPASAAGLLILGGFAARRRRG